MSGVTTATVIAGAGLALSAAGTAASMAGQSKASAAAGASAAQQQATEVYNAQVKAAQDSAQADLERSQAYQRVAFAKQGQELADRGATDALQRGEVAEQISRLKTAQVSGSQRAALASQGTDLAGSPTEVLADTAAAGEFEARTIRNNATREAYSYKLARTDAENAERQATADAAMAQFKQDNAKPGNVSINYSPGDSGVATTASLLSGASNLAEKWWKFQQNGAFGGSTTDPLASSGDAAALAAANTYGTVMI